MARYTKHITPSTRTFSGQALYVQIERWIRNAIENQSLQAGDQLPTEAALCEHFRVSRSTIRQAISQLERDGLVTRIRGKGTFLREARPANASHAAPASTPERTIGLIACRKHDTLQMEILLGLERAAKSRDYSVIFSCSGDSADGEMQEIERMMNRGVQGIVVMPVSNRDTTPGVEHLMAQRVPFVLVDRYLSRLSCDYVTSDNYTGAYRATEHLILLGYRRLAYVCMGESTLTTVSVEMRYKGFCGALDAYGLQSLIRPAHKIDVSDKEAVAGLLKELALESPNDLPPAIVAAHDAVAMSLMQTASRLGLTAPQHFAIVGFDDLPIAGQISVPLTTVAQQRFEMGFRAGHMLMDKIESRMDSNGKLELPVSLVVRKSCGAHSLTRDRDVLSNKKVNHL